MQYAENRALRERMYRAYATRASEFGPPELDNSALMRDILELRQEERSCWATPSFAESRWCPRWRFALSRCSDFLRDLARRARPFAERDMAELRDFAKTELGIAELQAWDVCLREREAEEKPAMPSATRR
jgi:oligopeptidase A